MTIEKHGNLWRIKEMRDGVTYRISVDYKPTKKEALALINKQISDGGVSGDASDTFQKAAERYFLLKSNILSPWTLQGYKTILRALTDRFKSTKLVNMDGVIVQKEINDYSATHSPKSTYNAHGFISAVLKVYKPQLTLNTTLPQKAKFEPVTPSEEDVKRIIEASAGSPYEVVFRLGAYGMRRGEVCAITSADLSGNMLRISKAKVKDGNHYIIRDMPKTTESNREIYVDDKVAAMIRAADGPIYPGDPDRINKRLTELQKALGIEHFRYHDLRAYYASMAHSLGIPDVYIMANGGWSSPRIMDRVYKRAFADKQAEMNKSIANHLG